MHGMAALSGMLRRRVHIILYPSSKYKGREEGAGGKLSKEFGLSYVCSNNEGKTVLSAPYKINPWN